MQLSRIKSVKGQLKICYHKRVNNQIMHVLCHLPRVITSSPGMLRAVPILETCSLRAAWTFPQRWMEQGRKESLVTVARIQWGI